MRTLNRYDIENKIYSLQVSRKHWDDCYKRLESSKCSSIGFTTIVNAIDCYNSQIEVLQELIDVYLT